MGRGRPGGNPDFGKKIKFQTERTEPLSEKITLRITASMLAKLEGLDNYREFCRKAIDEAIVRNQPGD